MKWAVAMQHRPDNPAGDALGEALGRQRELTHDVIPARRAVLWA